MVCDCFALLVLWKGGVQHAGGTGKTKIVSFCRGRAIEGETKHQGSPRSNYLDARRNPQYHSSASPLLWITWDRSYGNSCITIATRAAAIITILRMRPKRRRGSSQSTAKNRKTATKAIMMT